MYRLIFLILALTICTAASPQTPMPEKPTPPQPKLSDAQVRASFAKLRKQLEEARTWRKIDGKGIVLYYIPDKDTDAALMARRAEMFDWALRLACRTLQEKPLSDKVPVFLVPAGLIDFDDAGGAAGPILLTTLMSQTWKPDEQDWKVMAVHEMAHIVAWHRFGGTRAAYGEPCVLNEGVASYAQYCALGEEGLNPNKGYLAPLFQSNKPPLVTMMTREYSPDIYEHSAAFIGYLVNRDKGSWAKVKLLHAKLVGIRFDAPAIARGRLDQAFQSVYKVSLDEMERQWRLAEETGTAQNTK